MVGEFKTVRKGHEMTNRKMFFTMLWGAVVLPSFAGRYGRDRLHGGRCHACSALRRRVLPFHSR